MANEVNLEVGQRLLEACIAKARELNLRVSIAVVDQAGYQVCAARMDGSPLLAPDVAQGKAFAAATFRRTGKQFSETWAPGNPVGMAMIARTGGRFVPSQGSLLLKRGDEVVGAIGVSGARADEDEMVAQGGVDAFG